MKSLIYPAALALFALQACSNASPIPALEGNASCGADQMQHLLGQNESQLAGLTLPAATRIIHPDQAVTMDYSEGRLNIMVEDNGLISRLWCG